jgi:hypothetical protein
MTYKTWIEVGPDGEIISSRYGVGRGKTPPGMVECTDPAMKAVVMRRTQQAKLHVRDGLVCEKAKVRLRADRLQAVANGRDEIRVSLEGLPRECRSVRVRIGSDEVRELNRDEVLEVSWTRPARISIQLEEKLLLSEPLVLEFTEA